MAANYTTDEAMQGSAVVLSTGFLVFSYDDVVACMGVDPRTLSISPEYSSQDSVDLLRDTICMHGDMMVIRSA
jgi:hypothetical protein